MIFNNQYLNIIFLELVFKGYSKEDAIQITNNYINSCLNIQFLIKSKMKK